VSIIVFVSISLHLHDIFVLIFNGLNFLLEQTTSISVIYVVDLDLDFQVEKIALITYDSNNYLC